MKDLEAWLAEVDYSFLNSTDYVPTAFAFNFMNFIKLVNGDVGEQNITPPVHLAMLDKLALSTSKYLANLLFRGAAKTTVFMEYMCLYIAVFEELPHLGKISGMIYVSDSMDNGVKNARKNVEHRYESSEFLQHWLPRAGVKFTDNYMEFTNRNGHKLGVKMYGAKTGIRGTKIFGKRPTLAILDDLVSDEDAHSVAAMNTIKDTVYKGVLHALDPQTRRIVLNGTPFAKTDILIEAVESGGWDVNVYPVCERFPCEKEDFRGAWEDRFTFERIKEEYEFALRTGKISSFNQELMLMITSDEERLVQEAEIRWYSRAQLLRNKGKFNFYITTDFATSKKQSADFTVISVWAYNAQGDWFWVDGIMERQTMDKTFNDLFRLVQAYKPQAVGIEVTGQQGAFINLLREEMMNRDIWFNFASDSKTNEPGIRPTVDKLQRFNLVVPWFKAGKMYFPSEMKSSVIMGLFMGQIRLVTQSGIKGKDDAIDTISQLAYLKPWKPAGNTSSQVDEESDVFADDEVEEQGSALNNYIV
nr:MAG: terminase large subunit [Caudoviricetes sp.]